MKKSACQLIVFIVCSIVLLSPSLQAQLIVGQYEDEAPFRTWNTFGVPTATAISMGETQFALVGDSSATVINPARLTALPQFSISLSGAYTSASFDKYGVVNTGVLISDGDSGISLYGLDFLGFSTTFKGWALGLSVGLLENYDRPSQSPDYAINGEVLYLFQFRQTGYLRNYNLALAREFGEWISFGIGVNYISGSMEKSVVENMFYSDVTISDYKEHKLTGFYVNGGLTAKVADKLALAAVFRTPYSKKAESESRLRYDSPRGNTDIRIDTAAENTYKLPLVLGAGVDYRFTPQFRVTSDVSYFHWSSYSVTYFDEIIRRELNNIVKVSGGLEYMASLRMFKQDFQFPLRAGISYDPQPVKEPKTHYMYYSLGIGLYWKGLRLDAGAMFGSENGSGSDLYGRKFAITLSYFL
jgi:long-subunit fatty acid transport protein